MSATWQPQNGNGNRGPTPPSIHIHTYKQLTHTSTKRIEF